MLALPDPLNFARSFTPYQHEQKNLNPDFSPHGRSRYYCAPMIPKPARYANDRHPNPIRIEWNQSVIGTLHGTFLD
jgi:hypothetical protein